MPARSAALRKQLETHHAELQVVLGSLQPEQMQQAVYAHGTAAEWTVQALLAHMANAAEGMLQIAQAVARGANPVPEDWDIDRWNQSQVRKHAAEPAAALISRIQKAHAGWMQFVEDVSDLELEHTGRHPIGRTLSVKQMVQTHALHQVQHIRELAAAIAPSLDAPAALPPTDPRLSKSASEWE